MTAQPSETLQQPTSPSTHHLGRLVTQGLWSNNAATIQLLGLCPLLAVSNTVDNALGLGLATLFVLLLSSTLVSLLRHHIATEVRLPIFVLVIATAVTCVDLLLQAYSITLYRNLGIFIPLIVTNCLILARAEAFASRQPLVPAITDAVAMGAGFLLVIVVLGAIRQWLGVSLQVLVVALPPGAFIILGLLVAGVRWFRTQ